MKVLGLRVSGTVLTRRRRRDRLSGWRRLWCCLLVVASGCDSTLPVTPLIDADCPEGAHVVGNMPPKGTMQRCMRDGGIRHGKSRGWYENGRPRFETEWWEGRKHGRFTLWYRNGRKRAEGEDRHGIPVGTWTYWAEDGSVSQERTFELGAAETGRGAEAARRQPTDGGSAESEGH